jgi:hypothetical protein
MPFINFKAQNFFYLLPKETTPTSVHLSVIVVKTFFLRHRSSQNKLERLSVTSIFRIVSILSKTGAYPSEVFSDIEKVWKDKRSSVFVWIFGDRKNRFVRVTPVGLFVIKHERSTFKKIKQKHFLTTWHKNFLRDATTLSITTIGITAFALFVVIATHVSNERHYFIMAFALLC